MRCKDIQEHVDDLWTGEISPEVREHLAKCPACEGYARQTRLVRAGFHAMTTEPVPEATVGFAARLVRRLGEATDQGATAEFFERVGRRFVYATLLVTLGLLLALGLPSSGPVRGPATADLLLAQPELITARLDPIGGDSQDNQELFPVDLSSGGNKGQK